MGGRGIFFSHNHFFFFLKRKRNFTPSAATGGRSSFRLGRFRQLAITNPHKVVFAKGRYIVTRGLGPRLTVKVSIQGQLFGVW
jgi:hypothetical protein